MSLADENDYYSVTTLLKALMEERSHLQNTTMTVQSSGHPWKFGIKFYGTMYDEKLERKVVGLAG